MFTVSYPISCPCPVADEDDPWSTGCSTSRVFRTLAECDAFIAHRMAISGYTDPDSYWISLADEIRIGDLVIAG